MQPSQASGFRVKQNKIKMPCKQWHNLYDTVFFSAFNAGFQGLATTCHQLRLQELRVLQMLLQWHLEVSLHPHLSLQHTLAARST